MQNKTLLKISLAISIIGILILLILANNIKPSIIKIKDITSSYLDKKIQTQGKIISIRAYKESNFQVTSITDNSKSIEIISEITKLTKNQTISVIGTIKEYKNNLQIQADKIQLLSLTKG